MSADIQLAESSLDRTPPQSLEAEQAVLGALLISGDGVARVVDLLQPEYFYRKAHEAIYAAMLDLYENNEPIDIVTISQYLKDEGKLDYVGGRQYITDLALSVATTANLEYYGKVVQEKALLRHLIKAGTEIVGSCFEETDAEVAIDKAEHLIFTLAQRRNMSALVHIKNIVELSFEKIEQRYENRDQLSGVPTGFYDLDALTSGFNPSDLVIVAARPSMGKCLSFDSEIVLADGSIQTIEQLYQTRNAHLLTLGDDLKLKLTQPSAFVDDGLKPVFKVTTRLGRTVETTITHPFLTIGGWKKLLEISVGDKIAVPRNIPIFGTATMQECEVKLMAYLAANGILANGKATINSTNPAVHQDFQQAVEDCGADITELRQRLPGNGSLPQEAFKLNRQQLALLLNRLFATSGSASRLQSGEAQITFSAVSIKLTAQIQHLLLRFGVISKLRKRRIKCKSELRYQLDITDSASIRTFAEEIGIFGKEAAVQLATVDIPSIKATCDVIPLEVWSGIQLARGNESWASLGRRCNVGRSSEVHVARRALTRPRLLTLARGLENEQLANLATSDIYWDEIVSIEPVGVKQVYDLTIPETHNFVANDICVHNTAFVLNVAQHVAVEAQVPVAIFSLEMSKEQLVQRMLCSEANIDANRLRTGHMHTNDWTHLATAMGRLGEAPIYIDDSALVNALEIRAKCRRLKTEMNGLGLIIIDYIQLMQGRKATDNRVQEVSEISRSLKTLARELNVPVIALSQLSRAVEARQNKRPMLSDLRESGCLTGETAVYLPDQGTCVRIDSLVGKTGFNVAALNTESWQVESRSVTNSFCTGRKPVHKLSTNSGKQIRATANHKFLTRQGWKRLDQIPIGTDIAVRDGEWDKVNSITPDGEDSVYDLTVDGLHNFVANNITVHNSIEQDADIVMFIYRDEYYNPESEKRGEAEIIIAKQRNGPVGTVDLLYQSSITRFLNKVHNQYAPV